MTETWSVEDYRKFLATQGTSAEPEGAIVPPRKPKKTDAQKAAEGRAALDAALTQHWPGQFLRDQTIIINDWIRVQDIDYVFPKERVVILLDRWGMGRQDASTISSYYLMHFTVAEMRKQETLDAAVAAIRQALAARKGGINDPLA